MSAQDSPHASDPRRPDHEHLPRGANPLRHTTDRIEAWWSGFLLLVLVLGLPMASVSAGLAAYGSAMRAVQAQTAERHQVTARLTPDPDAARVSAADEKQKVRLSWTGEDGERRTGTAYVSQDEAERSTLRIWVDREGTVKAPPMSAGDAQATGWVMGGMTAVGVYVVLVAARKSMRLALDRSRYARWDTEWDLVEPQWSARFGR
ncbi:Rv1733c family protein [Streptomyces sp. NBC_00310]|uniref:Rv1733c family protein n=1 Tax=Streptomyces sp. NBC_00310 TaxID=2903645 RepID=UPI002E22525E